MFLRESTRTILENSIGKSIEELSVMDYDQEIEFIKEQNSKKPDFSKIIDYRVVARGNHLLTKKRIMTIEDVDRQILGWKKDER